MNIATSYVMRRIREQNDAFRKTFSGGKVMLTAGVDALPDMVKAAVLQTVATFDNFTEDNDPHGEHDFGSFELVNRTFFWRIDYYDRELTCGSDDPADPEKTTRVLTIMFASEY
jgi:Protein of unknown function (DUF3768)